MLLSYHNHNIRYNKGMLLVMHIIIALASLSLATILMIKPSRKGLVANNGLIALTLLSGTALLFDGAHLLSLCVSGLTYTAIAVGMTVVARRRLQTASVVA